MNLPGTKPIAATALLAALCAAGAASPGQEALIAHQGASRDAPGNTLPAFRLAVERGFGFECDVKLAPDGTLFTFHDDTLSRVTGGADRRRCEDIPWEELQRVNVGGAGKWKGTPYDGTRPALLSEALALARDGRWIYLDVKPRPGIAVAIRRALEAQSAATPANVLCICFDEATCAELRRELPEYKVFWISFARGRVGQPHRLPTPPVTAEEVVETLRRIGADGVDMQFDPELHDEAFIRAIREAGFEFHVWTVNDPATAILALRRGADSVTTDCAAALLPAIAAEAALPQ